MNKIAYCPVLLIVLASVPAFASVSKAKKVECRVIHLNQGKGTTVLQMEKDVGNKAIEWQGKDGLNSYSFHVASDKISLTYQGLDSNALRETTVKAGFADGYFDVLFPYGGTASKAPVEDIEIECKLSAKRA